MRKITLTASAVMLAIAANAQLVDVGSISRVELPAGMLVEQAVLSPDGGRVAFTDMRNPSLYVLNLGEKEAVRVSDNATALDLAFSADGSKLVFDRVHYDAAKRRSVSVHSYSLADGQTQTILEPTRNLQGVAIAGNEALAVNSGRLMAKGKAVKNAAPVLSINYGQLCVTTNGTTTVLSPLGRDGMSYLWPTLSPDGKRICFYAAGMGCYTCKLDGTDVQRIGWLRAAQWLDNNTVVGMLDRNDGVATTSSKLIARSIDGKVSQTLTGEEYIAVCPSVANGRIAFSTPEGELYLINLK